MGADDVGKTITIRARLANSRQQGNKMLFVELRQSLVSIQGLLALNQENQEKPLVGILYLAFVLSSQLELRFQNK